MVRDNRNVTGAERLGRRMKTIAATLAIAPLQDAVANLLLDRTRKRFDRQVSPGNVPWKELETDTIIRKLRGWPGAKMLVRTGEMRKAIKIIRGGAGAVYGNTGAGVRIGIDDEDIVPYAKVQNSGSRTVTARRFLGVDSLDVKAVDGLLRRKAQRLESI